MWKKLDKKLIELKVLKRSRAMKIRWLKKFFKTRACVYSYHRELGRREADERSHSLLSRLCYKVNKRDQDEFCRQPLLAMAFIEAKDEVIKHLQA